MLCEKHADKLRKTNQNCNDYTIIISYLDSIPSYRELQQYLFTKMPVEKQRYLHFR